MNSNESFQTLVLDAIAILSLIAEHPDFTALLETERWDYPENSLFQIRECLEDLKETHSEGYRNEK